MHAIDERMIHNELESRKEPYTFVKIVMLGSIIRLSSVVLFHFLKNWMRTFKRCSLFYIAETVSKLRDSLFSFTISILGEIGNLLCVFSARQWSEY